MEVNAVIIVYWTFLLVLVAIQIGAICIYQKNGVKKISAEEYSKSNVNAAKTVMDAIGKGVIKKHIPTNNVEKYDSHKALTQYKQFLKSSYMQDLKEMGEGTYHE